jgi:hypothetical protein
MKTTKSEACIQKTVSFLVCMLFFVQVGCGTILYPERRGQQIPTIDRLEKVDPLVVVLDGILLFAFLVPGVVAFAVDFSTGAIYLPPGETNFLESKSAANPKDVQIVRINRDNINIDTIKRLVQKHTGHNIDFDSPNLHFFKPYDPNIDIKQELSKLRMGILNTTQGTWFSGSQANFITDSLGRFVRVEVIALTKTYKSLEKAVLMNGSRKLS